MTSTINTPSWYQQIEKQQQARSSASQGGVDYYNYQGEYVGTTEPGEIVPMFMFFYDGEWFHSRGDGQYLRGPHPYLGNNPPPEREDPEKPGEKPPENPGSSTPEGVSVDDIGRDLDNYYKIVDGNEVLDAGHDSMNTDTTSISYFRRPGSQSTEE